MSERRQILSWIEEAGLAGARRTKACALLGIALRSLQRWQESGEVAEDGRCRRQVVPSNKLSDPERQAVLSMANSAEFAALAPSQIVPILASESTFYRILREARHLQYRQASRAATGCRKPKALKAAAPNQLYSWDITYLPTSVKGVFFYL
ncbi:MAG: hypothetical protein ACU841_11565 [Gammaproteobacteria bacterium]